jgi:pyruvate formate lyase activating enzyme
MGHKAVPYEQIRALVKSLQPDCLFTDHTHLNDPWDVDITNFEEPAGSFAPANNTYAGNQETKINAAGGNDWFWAPNIGSLMSVTAIVDQHLRVLEPRWTNFLLNCPPNRQGLLDAVVFSGGEPTAQAALPDALAAVKELGYLVALHTNGYNMAALGRALATGALDYVAMDIKAPFARYDEVTRVAGSGRQAQRSATAIIKSGIDHEFRTTYHSALLSPDQLRAIAEDLQWRGAQSYYLQRYRDEGSPDMPLALSLSRPPPQRLLRELEKMLPRFGTRGW